MAPPPFRYRTPYWLYGVIVVLVGFACTAWLLARQDQRIVGIEQARFEQRTSEINLALTKRLASYTEVVYGLRGWFVANPQLTRAQFQRGAEELDASSRNAGLVNLSFSRRLAAQDLAAFEESVRADPALPPGLRAGFRVHPEAQRDEYFVAEYLWPPAGNELIFGLDISSQPANLTAMQHARATGEVVVSAPFQLLQNALPQSAVIVRVPIFSGDRQSGAAPATENFLGAVAVTLNVTQLMQAVRLDSNSEGVAIELSDLGAMRSATGTGPARVFYRDSGTGDAVDTPLRPATRTLTVHDRHWQLVFYPTDRFLSVAERRIPILIAVTGTLLALLLGVVISLLVLQRRRALLRAHSADAARAVSEGQFQSMFTQAAMGVALVELETGRLSEVNARFCHLVGKGKDALRDIALCELFESDEDSKRTQQQLAALSSGEAGEFADELALAPTGSARRWVARSLSVMHLGDAAPTQAIVLLNDINARVAMEDALRLSEARLRALLYRLPVGVMLMDEDGSTALCNQRFTELTGYTEHEVPNAEVWWAKAYPDPGYRASLTAKWNEARAEAPGDTDALASEECAVTAADGRTLALEVAGVRVGTQLLVTFVDLSQRKAAEQEIRTLAYSDLLTGLPNRRLLVRRLEDAIAHTTAPVHCALLLLDLDNFKTLNDTRGHDRGDALLKQVAARISACVRSDDTVARPGGDEFAVLLEGVGNSVEEAVAHCERLGQTILNALRQPYLIDGEAHHSTMSIGATVFSAGQHSVEGLLQQVDLAMYQAKAAGRDTLRFYDPHMHEQVSERAALEDDMRNGLGNREFELYYQPQVDHGRIVGAEALLRWRHPQRGFVSPEVFIPLAEESGLILPLGQWVLEQACLTLAQWARDPLLAELTLAVNVSPRQFRQAGFVQQVLGALASTGASARRLKLEITEGLLLQDVNESAARMTELKSYGVGFSLDDFGTGYSSLSYLKRLPLDQLKIDQSFVRDVLIDPNDASIVRTIVALGASLGLQVLAEGVETAEQEEFLQRQHCHAWQGYLLSRPVPVDQFVDLVRAHASC